MSTADAFNLASLLATIGSLSSDNLSSGLNKLMTIKNTLGFSELGVQSNLSLDALGTPYGSDESGFVVGRYLTSKIYVRYISGISTELNLFQLQYLFNPNWSIQLQSGSVESTNVEGIDGLYHFTHFFSSPKKK
jgi:autotransporter translocation and assembly factor TamB